VLALLLFPTSFFLGALYTEALFLLLVVGSFWFARKKHWLLAGLLAGIASGTRVMGVFLWPALILELWWQTKPANLIIFIKSNLKTIGQLSLSLVGIISYMLYLWLTFADPISFLNVQSEFGAGRQESLVLFPQVLWRYTKILWTIKLFDWKYYSYVQDLVLSLTALSGLLVFFKKIRPSYLLFALLAFFLPPLTGTLSSMPRYLLVCFPIFILLGQVCAEQRVWRVLLLTSSTILLIINTILFIQGYWVA
jgi:Gpi18-like mannosyltransferase